MIDKKQAQGSSEFWSTFAKEYDRTFYDQVTQYPSLVLRHKYILEMFDKPGGNVLDVGCGPGKMIVDLINRGCSVTGLDIAPGMLEVARANIEAECPGYVPKLILGNIEHLDLDDAIFDAVICAGVIEYMSDDYKSLIELTRVLKPGGTLLLSVRNKACPARIIDFITDFIKRSKVSLKALSVASGYLMGNKSNEIKFTPYRKHSIPKLHKNLAAAGFAPEDFRYFHFYPFFVPFDKLAPKFFVRQGLKMETLSHTRLGWLASGYIVKGRKSIYR
jgi:ubiquinone/menaquinone biosynthesis C-methylase UbiE